MPVTVKSAFKAFTHHGIRRPLFLVRIAAGFPSPADDYIEKYLDLNEHLIKNPSATLEHEATTSKISADQLFYFSSRGIGEEETISILLNGFCKEVFNTLPAEFSVEAVKLLEMKLENSVG